jgi:putative MFS transporter
MPLPLPLPECSGPTAGKIPPAIFRVGSSVAKSEVPSFYYSCIQGGWPLGFLLASALALVILPTLGWRALCLMATSPAVTIVWVIAKKLKESLQHELTTLEKSGRNEQAHALANS